ncbi:MAG: hypothetical protein Q8L64_06630 [bacterium]|nr:hypothetical protein [bacterium]
MEKCENATTAQFLQLVARFAQVLPLDADKAEAQKAIENEDDPLWIAIKSRFTKKVQQVVKSLKDMIALGHYDWVNSDINEKNFGLEALVLGEGAELFHFDHNIFSEDAIAKMAEKGFKPGTLGDLLVYGAKNPEEQKKYPIVALGSVASVGGERYVACLDWNDSERGLRLRWFDDDWRGDCRFLAVRK